MRLTTVIYCPKQRLWQAKVLELPRYCLRLYTSNYNTKTVAMISKRWELVMASYDLCYVEYVYQITVRKQLLWQCKRCELVMVPYNFLKLSLHFNFSVNCDFFWYSFY